MCAMKQFAVLAIAMAAFLLLFWLAQRPAKGNRRPATHVLARLLRRAGRRLWALGEAVEIGFFHARQVRDRCSLDLDPNGAGGRR
jgi:hypothetical protein